MFHVGQKVVCVDDDRHLQLQKFGAGGLSGLKKGRVYTVRQMLVSWRGDDIPSVRLMEIVRPGLDTPYWAFRFRPVTERRTDISVFTAMLSGAPNELERIDG